LARFGDQIKRPDLAVYMARQAARKGHHLITHGYPILPTTPALPALVPAVNPAVEAALLHGLIRQESAFNSRAVSRAGARGLMQLMPATAKQIAQKTKLRFATERLLEEPQFNLQLGQLYLHQMIMTFAGSYPLALAAYNAGPHRVKRWLRDYGDPRTGAISMINWIESIPFNETRNYVQRVLEATVVYRHKEASLNDLTAAHLSVHQWCLLRCQDASIAAVPTTESPKPAR
jgi:soluble lytic murein transglycosylase